MKKTPNSVDNFETAYYKLRTSVYNQLPNEQNEIIFLGNSIIDYGPWESVFHEKNIKNRGIAGDVIPGLINRLKEITEARPQKIFIMIGTNDLAEGNSPSEILQDYQLLLEKIKDQSPDTEIYIHSILPTFGHSNRDNKSISEVNEGLQKLAQITGATFIDLHSVFVNRENLFPDGLHINGEGYLLWVKEISDYVYN
ncbi:MAG: GDSL-type esterase/lipase family protein [Salinimicrobium sp.]